MITKQNQWASIYFLNLCLLSSSGFAASSALIDNTTKNEFNRPDKTTVFTLSMGPAWSDAQTTQTFLLQPDLKKTYTSTNGSTTLIDGEVFAGIQKTLHPKIDGQIGLAVAGASNSNLSGNVWEDGNPNFNNYVYKYSVNHAHVAIKGKLLGIFQERYQPYLSASVGVGFNRSSNFSLTPKIEEEIPAPLFQANTTTAFTYTVGVGVQTAINDRWKVGVGYEFADWGQSHLAAAIGQTIGNGPSLSHLYTNELQFSLSYFPRDI